MKCKQFLIAAILLASVFSSCLKDENIKLPVESDTADLLYIPEQLNDGWEISTPEEEGFERNKIDRVYEKLFSEDLYPTARSVLIVRNGKLVAEAYCRDKHDRDNYHNLQSATKSITSMLIGIAIDKGMIESVNVPIYNFIPQYFDHDPRKRAITLYHALTMQTGLEFDNDENTVELFYYPGNSLEYVLQRGLSFMPGSSFYYHDGNPQLISGVIQKVSGMTEEEFAVENLFNPLAINHYQWERHADGSTFGAFGLWLRPRDMAKIGKLVAQNGIWNGEQIVSATWIAESTKIHANTNYGYYWWITKENNIFSAEGDGVQIIFIAQEKNLVIVLTADPYSSDAALSPALQNLIGEIMEAIIE